MGRPSVRRIVLRAVDAGEVRRVRLVATDDLLEWSSEEGQLAVTLPDRLPSTAVTALDLGDGVQPRPGFTHR
jgi:hypothetical protein